MNNEEKQESVWSKAIPFKEQVAIFKRLMGFVKHFKFEMTIALIGAFLVSIINILLPRGLQCLNKAQLSRLFCLQAYFMQ